MLMQGIEIMASQEIVTKYDFNWLSFWITFGAIFGINLIVGIIKAIKEDEAGFFLFLGAVGICIGLLLGTIFGGVCRKPVKYTTEYKVAIEDNVPLTEFYEHYEVVGQEGKMFIVREKAE